MRTRRRTQTERPRFDSLEERCLLAFGLTTTSSLYTVDTGAGVTFSVLRGGTLTSTVHLGDLTSFKRNGIEFAAPFAAPGPQRYSHFESGLSTGTVMSATIDPAGNWIKIAADDTIAAGKTGVIQYYIAKKNDPTIYMATYAPEMLVSSTRFITYLDWNRFPNHPNPSDTSAIHGTAQTTIESGDVFQDPVDGWTHSKYYEENRLIGHVYHGATGATSGAFMFIGNRESGSGGPFWKDIDFQSTGAAVELYNMPYSDHSQTEPFRPGLHGPYALVLTGGTQPTTTPDYTFLDGVGLTGWVSPSARGTLTGKATGIAPGRVPTVALSNTTAQYWATPDASGNYTIPGIKPGTYSETLYDEELAVGTRTVTINAGQTTFADITSTYYLPNAVWRVGTWDGTPREFLNGDKITDMHPSDPRMAPWVNTTFTIGSPDNLWPMAQWKDATLNAINRITFDLTAEQAATPMTLRIGITRAQAGGRPIISVNSGSYSSAPSPSTQPGTRGITLGSWRGNNWLYTYNISTSALHAGTNTIDIQVASGSSSTSKWLQPEVTYDALDLVPTSSLTNAPVVASITVSPVNPTLEVNAQQLFTAVARDQFGNITPANFNWFTDIGSINGVGLLTAPAIPGNGTVRANSGLVNGTTTAYAVDTTPVQVNSATFGYQATHLLTFTFNKMNVSATTAGVDLVLQNLTTSEFVTSVQLTYSPFTGTYIHPGILLDGNYRATLPAGSVRDPYGNTLGSEYSFTFFVLAGDANHDRIVDVNDLMILSDNWMGSGKTFAQGDFNYDGLVNQTDLGIMAQHWQQQLTLPPPPPSAPSPTGVRTPARSPTRTAARLVSLI